jgi:hypothetical protein
MPYTSATAFTLGFVRFFFRVCELSFGRQARERKTAKKKVSEENSKKKSKKSQIRIKVGLT